MRQRSRKLTMLLVVRGALRVLAPITVVWGIAAWWYVGALAAVVYGLLVWNYVLVYILTWTAPKAIHGPWRVRPVQTFIVLGNSFVLPWAYYERGWPLPWGFLAMCVIYHIALFVSTYILLYLQEHLPMGGIFAQQRTGLLRGLDGSAWGQRPGPPGG